MWSTTEVYRPTYRSTCSEGRLSFFTAGQSRMRDKIYSFALELLLQMSAMHRANVAFTL